MRARFLVHGVLRRSDGAVVLYGDIVEGSIRAGMRITVPSGAGSALTESIRSIEFLDTITNGVTYVGLALQPQPADRIAWDQVSVAGLALDVGDEREGMK